MFHLRFTPYDISGYTFDFLDHFDKYVVAQEDVEDDGSPLKHYHILICTDYGVKSIRDAAKLNLKIPPAGKGKNNKYYALIENWEDPGYICKYNNIQKVKGYTDKEIMDFVISGKKKYLDKVKRTELSGSESPAVSPKIPRVPFQQLVLSQAAADWYNYKRDNASPDKSQLIEFVCKAMRDNGRGINQYLVKEICYGILFDDLDYRDWVLTKIKSSFSL